MEKKETSGFFKFPNNVLNCPHLPIEAKALFAYIASKPENWKFSSFRMARELGCGESTVKKYRAFLENVSTNSDDPKAPMLIRKNRDSDGFYTYTVNLPSYEIQPVKIQPVKIQPVKIQPVKIQPVKIQTVYKDGYSAIPKKKNTEKGEGFSRRPNASAERLKIAKHFAHENAEKAEKSAVGEAKRARGEWISENPDKAAEIEKKHRLRLESERPDMLKQARDVMIQAATYSEISKIIKSA